MISTNIALIISGGGLLLSVITAASIVSVKYGSLKERIREIEQRQSHAATKEDLTPIKESLAEIRGMFRLELKDK